MLESDTKKESRCSWKFLLKFIKKNNNIKQEALVCLERIAENDTPKDQHINHESVTIFFNSNQDEIVRKNRVM